MAKAAEDPHEPPLGPAAASDHGPPSHGRDTSPTGRGVPGSGIGKDTDTSTTVTLHTAIVTRLFTAIEDVAASLTVCDNARARRGSILAADRTTQRDEETSYQRLRQAVRQLQDAERQLRAHLPPSYTDP